MRNYEPKKISSYTAAYSDYLNIVQRMLGTLNQEPRTRDLDIVRHHLLKSTIENTYKLGEVIIESMSEYLDIETPTVERKLVTNSFNVSDLDTAFTNLDPNETEVDYDEYDEEEDDV